MIQLREKDQSDRDLWQLAVEMRELAREHGACLIVNDRIDIALAAGADGVHLGSDDVPIDAARRAMGADAIIGASVACPAEAEAAEGQGASYVSVGSVFATTSKPDAGEAIGISRIGAVKHATRLPVIAIGGISSENVGAVIRGGADGVAVLSAVAEAGDMAAATSELRRLICEARRRAE